MKNVNILGARIHSSSTSFFVKLRKICKLTSGRISITADLRGIFFTDDLCGIFDTADLKGIPIIDDLWGIFITADLRGFIIGDLWGIFNSADWCKYLNIFYYYYWLVGKVYHSWPLGVYYTYITWLQGWHTRKFFLRRLAENNSLRDQYSETKFQTRIYHCRLEGIYLSLLNCGEYI